MKPYSPQHVPQHVQPLSPHYIPHSPHYVPHSPRYMPQYEPQYAQLPFMPPRSPRYTIPYSPHDASPYSPQYAPQLGPRSSSPAPTWAFVGFRVVTIVLSVPLIVITSKLVHGWPSVFHKAAIAFVAGALAITSDLVVVKLFLDRSRYFAMILVLDGSIVILAIAAIVEFVRAGAADDAPYATDRLLGIAFSFIVCGVRLFSVFINSIVACMMRSRSPARRRSRTVQIAQATEELY